ncbi:hypothetical protein B9Z55_012272 [Caenorhabditis nigoni]|nr:hypothetical protein B9Z55_012272 [Caenorhabditis nigoni]
MTEHICEVLRSPIRDIQIAHQSIIEWIIKFQPTVRNVWIWNNAITSVGTLDRILKHLKVTDCVGFDSDSVAIKKKFQITEPLPSRSISIRNSYWLTVPAILNGNNSVIQLFDSKFTSKDVNTLLKEWLIGSKLRNLEYLSIHTTTLLDSDEVLKDLNWTDGDENDGRPNTV